MLKVVMGSMRKFSLVSIACLSLVACSGDDEKVALTTTTAPEKTVINFGIISTESSQNLKSDWQPLLDDMGTYVGAEIKPFFASDYAGVIQAMRFGKVDMAWYGNKSAMEAVDRASGEVFAKVVYDDGSKGYKSVLITQSDSPINNVEDMLSNAGNLNFGNGDPNSTSGYLVPAYYVFGKNNVEPTKIFKRTLNANHESNLMAVANKQVDVATFNSNSWDMMKERQPEVLGKVKMIWESPEIPSDPLVWRTDMSDEMKAKVKTFFLEYGDTPKGKEVLKRLSWSKFEASNNDQLKPIRELEAFKNEQAKKRAVNE